MFLVFVVMVHGMAESVLFRTKPSAKARKSAPSDTDGSVKRASQRMASFGNFLASFREPEGTVLMATSAESQRDKVDLQQKLP